MTMDVISSFNGRQEDFFKEKVIPQKFQVTINPQKIPLLNGWNTFVDQDGSIREMTPDTKVYCYQDKIVIVQKDGIFTSEDAWISFKNIIPKESENEGRNNKFNERAFQASGDIIVSRYVERDWKSEYDFFINGKKYTSPTGKWYWNLWDSCIVKFVGDKIYATSRNQMISLNAQQSKLMLLSEDCAGDNWVIDVLDNGKMLKQTVKITNNETKRHIQVDWRDWGNDVVDQNVEILHNQNHIWMWNPWELIIDDRKYDLSESKGHLSNECQISENGNVVAIDFDYNEAMTFGEETKSKRGKHILLGDKNGIKKDIIVEDSWIKKIAVDDEGQLAYVTKPYTGLVALLHIDGFQYELDIKKPYDAIKEFIFVGKNTVRIKYLNFQDEIVEKEISLNTEAEQIKEKLLANEQAEKQSREVQEFINKNGLTSVEQLTKILSDANKYDALQTRVQEKEWENTKLEMRVEELKKEKETLKSEKATLETEKAKLEETIKTIQDGIEKRTLWGYNILESAKIELWIK